MQAEHVVILMTKFSAATFGGSTTQPTVDLHRSHRVIAGEFVVSQVQMRRGGSASASG